MPEEKSIKIRISRINTWMVATIVLLVLLVAFLATNWNLTGAFTAINMLTPEQAGKKAIEFINENLVQPGTSASLVSVEEISGIYDVTTSYQGQEISVYITKDGKYLITGMAFDTSQPIPKQQEQQQQETRTIGNFIVTDQPVCKKDGKVSVYFFGTSWCPHCTFLKPLFQNAVDKFDNIDLHAWYEMDKEPPTEEDNLIFQKFNPRRSVPTVIIGCKYWRAGTMHARDGKPELETKEITALICKLTENQPINVCNEVQDLIKQI